MQTFIVTLSFQVGVRGNPFDPGEVYSQHRISVKLEQVYQDVS